MKLPVIIGPTGSGKTDLALKLSAQLPTEVVSADSRKIYRYLDIGTAKPTPYQKTLTNFHMIDICDPDQYFSAGDYGKQATKEIKKILQKDKIPLVVGGSGLYIDTIFNPLPPLPKPDPQIREEIDQQEKEYGLDSLYKILTKVDQEWAQRVDPHDRQRVKRGLEVHRTTGKRLSDLIKKQPRSDFEPQYLGIELTRDQLQKRVKKRITRMINDGLVCEVKWLLDVGFDEDINALKSIGYQECIKFLKKEITYDALPEVILHNTLLFAKRQITWFRRIENIYWVTKSTPWSELISLTKKIG